MSFVGDIVLAWPWVLWLLPIPLLFWWIVPPASQHTQRALKVASLSRFERLAAQKKLAYSVSPWLLLALLCWCLLVLATARPQWLGAPVSAVVSGRDLMLSIDISGSMDERDMQQGQRVLSRMDVVRQLSQDFVSRRTGDRIGLIMFGSQAYVQTPLTFDHAAVQHFLGEAQVGLAGKSTAIGDAIGLGIKRLRDREEQSRVLVLITDGANAAGVVTPLEAAEMAAQSNIRIHTIGVGPDSKDMNRRRGLWVQPSEIDEATLQEIAQVSGGRYFRARNVGEMQAIYAAIDDLEPAENEEKTFRPLIELFPWPLGVALLLSVIAALLHLRRMAR